MGGHRVQMWGPGATAPPRWQGPWLDACEDWKVVRWCRTQASTHNAQGLLVGGVDEAGMSTAAPNWSAVLCG